MKRYERLAVLVFMLWSWGAPFAQAEKFGSLSTDTMIQQDNRNEFPSSQSSLPSTASVPGPSKTITAKTPWQTPQLPAGTEMTAPADVPAAVSTADMNLPAPATSMPQMKNFADIRPPDITVPDYEAKFRASIEAKTKAVAERKKQMKLIDRILEEVANYGIWLILGLVAFILAYSIYKEKETDEKISAEQELQEQKIQGEKKDIWKDEF
jgi:hypothetical protein